MEQTKTSEPNKNNANAGDVSDGEKRSNEKVTEANSTTRVSVKLISDN